MTSWAVLVSEVMLQQTPVARVEPVWRDWMERWPTPSELASSTLAEVLRRWGQLGYPRRARNLHLAAQIIHTDHGGQVPMDLDLLLALPGIGSYTARAVLCFAGHERHPVVDTNVSRVVARWHHGLAAGGAWGQKVALFHTAETLRDVPDKAYPEASVALMELGALVCTAKSPSCGACPLQDVCQWRARGFPVDPHTLPRGQARYEGSDRQARGVILHALRSTPGGLDEEALQTLWPTRSQFRRALDSLLREELVVEETVVEDTAIEVRRFRLPGD